ncbi:hypothetical protein Tco_0626802 [Tanacetum coccineum]|uniref:Uncharacterized protein n=1 Tax=Tanacetum coccineum TaxID=301880 RepID=A0ABQ4WKL0_9ASTR
MPSPLHHGSPPPLHYHCFTALPSLLHRSTVAAPPLCRHCSTATAPPKETELYRNGCTQRIRACERIPLDKKLPFSVKTNDNKNTDKKDEVPEKEIVFEQVKEMDIAANNSCERATLNKKLSFSVKTNENNNPKSISKKEEVLDKEIVLVQVKEIDIAADNSCLTSQSSVKHTNDTTIQEIKK